MYLKSLELFGFKSFPDRTVLNFAGSADQVVGATVVVGPNGSGKSNISDAMRWVLGEVSSKSIRGTRMEDVIFGGTDDRKQMNFAEVSVTFDNTDRLMEYDSDEVIVTRRYLRRGESEYFINRRPVRLKDIHELFMNTGVGREGYSIIGQGRIAEIISQRSEDRRSIFEEAAGISKYRYKKEEAEGKLASVDENLTRLNDIMSELESRVAPLEKEAERAKKYLEYYEIKKRDDISLWLYDSDRLSTELEAANDRFTLAKTGLDIASEALSTLESKNERVFEASQESKYQYERLQGELDSETKRQHELDSDIKLTENDIAHRDAQISERRSAREKLDEKRGENERGVSEKRERLEKTRERGNELSDKMTALSERIEKLNSDRAALTKKLDDRLAAQKRDEERLVELKIRLSVLDASEKNDAEKIASTEADIEKYKKSIALLDDRAAKAVKAISDYDEKAEELRGKMKQLSVSIEAEKNKKQEYIDKSNAVYLDYTAKKHRIDAIRRMEELFEGYSQSVRFIMNEYEAGRVEGTRRLQDAEPGGKIWGPVSRHISVANKYVLAIETALGANIQNIIVDDDAAAKAAIAYLKKKNAGRATFYPISSMKPRYSPIPEAECRKYAGYIGTADSVVKYDERFDGIIRNLLASTLIFDNLDNASAMAKATGYRARVVTLDGQVINAGGSFTGGSAKRDSGMLTRKSETEKLKRETAELSDTLESFKRAQAECDANISANTKQNGELSARLAMLVSLSGAEKTQLEILKTQLEGEKKLTDSLESDLERLKNGSGERSDGMAQLNAEADELKKAARESAQSREKDAACLGELENELDDADKEREELLVSRAENGKDIESAEKELSEAELRLAESFAGIQENIEAINRLTTANEEAQEKLGGLRAELDDSAEKLNKLGLERAELSAKNLEFEAKLTKLRAQIKEHTDKKEQCFREYTFAETKQKGLVSERDKLSSRLWEDYELTYSGALEIGRPVSEDERPAMLAELADMKAKLKSLGNVNLSAIDEYAEVKKRCDFMTAQINDLTSSKGNLLEIIFKLETEMRETFSAAFAEIDRNFKIVFRELFGGGTAELVLSDPDNVLESGIEIRVAPPGKIIKSLTLLSGGEQAFVAIAIIFSILRVNPTPFCIFDEIEAALDESNVFRFADYLRRYSERTQFIVITHRRGTMEIADRIYGVTMQERGISKVLELDMKTAEASLGENKDTTTV